MKLHSLEIKNFRAIKDISLDFTDLLSRPRPISLIVGPNSSGKTSILDAIHVVVKDFENPNHPSLRNGLQYNVQQLVRGRGNIAQITFEYSIERDEAEAINEGYSSHLFSPLELDQLFDFSQGDIPPLNNPAKVTWEFPNTDNSLRTAKYIPKNSIKVLGARRYASESVGYHTLDPVIFEKIGGVCYIDQRRNVKLFEHMNFKISEQTSEHDNILYWLSEYSFKDSTWNEKKFGESYWKRIKRLFNKICFPSKLIGLESGPCSHTLILERNGMEYNLPQMSSGEHQILRILIGLAADIAKNSIVLIDEVELHLHPAWQKRLIQVLREDDSNNQYIFTTHSPTVAKMFYNSEIINLGDLEET